MAEKFGNLYPFRPRTDRPKIDVNNQLAARRAIQTILQSQRMAIISRRFHGGGKVTTRVSVDGIEYEVDALRYEQLQSGLSPADLELQAAEDTSLDWD